ncbi:hypothetical protein LTR17_017939 [Elasticomyces elasticus]|nr:hypothetical protein LTR17_017939 [Elasticomyces elasticus]
MTTLEAHDLFNVRGMVFLVTGGGSGIGAMIAKALAANGAAKVYIMGRRKEKLEETASCSSIIVPIQGDVGSKLSLKACADEVASQIPFVNTVIACSGAQGPTVTDIPKDRTPSILELHEFLWKPSMEDFDEAFHVNSTGMFYTMVAFLPLLDAGNTHSLSSTVGTTVSSQFLVIGSIGAYSKKPGMGFAYAGSKAAAILMVKQIATLMVPYNIRANMLNPGIYPSDMSAAFLAGKDATQPGSLPQSVVPSMRAGSGEDMAGAILFMCSKAGAYINSNVINSDGGRLAIVPSTF